MKNLVENSTKTGERFELCYKPFAKRLVVTCLETPGKLSFIKPIEEFMGNTLFLAEEGVYMDAEYECRSKREFKRIVAMLVAKNN